MFQESGLFTSHDEGFLIWDNHGRDLNNCSQPGGDAPAGTRGVQASHHPAFFAKTHVRDGAQDRSTGSRDC